MLTVLLDSPAVLTAVIAVLFLLNRAIRVSALRVYSRQSVVEHDLGPPGQAGTVRSERAQLTWPFISAIVAISLTLTADPITREIAGGGYLVLMITGLVMNIESWLTARALLKPAAAEGHIRYSMMFGYRSGAARALGFALFTATVGILLGNLAFMAGSVFLLATAIGYYRSGRRAAREAASGAHR